MASPIGCVWFLASTRIGTLNLEVFHGKRSDSRGQRIGGAAVSERGCGPAGGPLERRRFSRDRRRRPLVRARAAFVVGRAALLRRGRGSASASAQPL